MKRNIYFIIFICMCIQLVVAEFKDFQEFLDAANYTNAEEENVDYELLVGNYNGNLSVEVIKQIRKCERNDMVMELCMRCAIVTKAEIVYPMCCANEDNVLKWCYNYLNFGRKEPMTDEEMAAVPFY